MPAAPISQHQLGPHPPLSSNAGLLTCHQMCQCSRAETTQSRHSACQPIIHSQPSLTAHQTAIAQEPECAAARGCTTTMETVLTEITNINSTKNRDKNNRERN